MPPPLIGTDLAERPVSLLIFFAGKLENYKPGKDGETIDVERAENHNLPLACTPFSSNGALATFGGEGAPSLKVQSACGH